VSFTASAPLASFVDGNYSDAVTPTPKNSGTLAVPVRSSSTLKTRIRFVTNAKKWIAFGGSPLYQFTKVFTNIKVNGRFLSEASLVEHTAALINPGGFLLDLTQFDLGPKVIEIYIQDSLLGAAPQFAIGTDEYIMPFSQSSDYKIAIEGDSIFDNTFIASFHYSWRTEQAFGNLLGCGNVYSNTIGGTGLISDQSGTATTYIQRLSDIVSFNPDLLIIGGCHNDVGQTSTVRKAAMLAYLKAVRSALPNVVVAIFGTNLLQGETVAAHVTQENDWVSTLATLNDPLMFLIPVATATPALLPVTANNGSMWQSNALLGVADGHPTGFYNMHVCNVAANAIRKWVAQSL
jgi:lysophospholipase L1-like esterase